MPVVSYFISDGFQSTQHRRITATFFDFSLASDRICRTELLVNMPTMGVPRRITEWLSTSFTNRTDRLRVNVSIGPSRTFNKGRTQGSVLVPSFSQST